MHFMCLIDIDPNSKIFKVLLNESLGTCGPRLFQTFNAFGFRLIFPEHTISNKMFVFS